MTYFLKSGRRYNVTTQASMDLHESLPVGTYTVKFDPMGPGFFLEEVEGFEITGKIYGDTQKHADRILDTFNQRTASTGVMLSGEKGSGKTLLAKKLSLDAQAKGIPTIIINNPWCGEEFNGFMQKIEQPVVVIFDEFEKVYDSKEQEQMLTLLDGVYPSKKLFIITCNDKWRVNEHMKNRPGRIFYRLDYKGLDAEFIREYCADNLQNDSHAESIARIAVAFSEFNFDILKAMVEEMNRYGESPQDVMKMLNAKPEQSESAKYDTTLHIGGVDVTALMSESVWGGNPLVSEINLPYKNKARGDDEDYWSYANFSVSDLQKIDPATGQFIFQNSAGEVITLVKKVAAIYNYHAF